MDQLTGLMGPREFEAALKAARESAAKAGGSLTLLLVDLDGLKSINFSHGVAAGDAALASLAQWLVDLVGPRGEVTRLGGDDFGILLPNTELSEGVELAEQIRSLVADPPGGTSLIKHGLGWPDSGPPLTVSIGASSGAPDTDFSSLLREADLRLYRAKAENGNMVVGP